jgi:hypothetical protein
MLFDPHSLVMQKPVLAGRNPDPALEGLSKVGDVGIGQFSGNAAFHPQPDRVSTFDSSAASHRHWLHFERIIFQINADLKRVSPCSCGGEPGLFIILKIEKECMVY